MNWQEKMDATFGRILYVDNGVVELKIPLDYGIRIGHFSFIGQKNVFFEQPADMTELTTEDGWRIRGGHRLWLAPENLDTYCPDNDPITYEIRGEQIILCQEKDAMIGVKKSIQISFKEDASVHLVHRVENCSNETIVRSLWAVSAMAPGGTEYIPLGHREGEMSHWHRISWWDHTCLGDERVIYEKERIQIRQLPIQKPYKIGVGHPDGSVQYINNHAIFEKTYDINMNAVYPDGNVSFETYFCQHMAEIESLSPLYTINPGETAEHQELWTLYKV